MGPRRVGLSLAGGLPCARPGFRYRFWGWPSSPRGGCVPGGAVVYSRATPCGWPALRVACVRATGLHACDWPACVRVACLAGGLHACDWPADGCPLAGGLPCARPGFRYRFWGWPSSPRGGCAAGGAVVYSRATPCVWPACVRVACLACGLRACVWPALRVACLACGLRACGWPACVRVACGSVG